MTALVGLHAPSSQLVLVTAVGVDYLYSAPYAGIYRGMGIVAANGVSTLPHNCLLIACLMALGAVLMNLTRVSAYRELGRAKCLHRQRLVHGWKDLRRNLVTRTH